MWGAEMSNLQMHCTVIKNAGERVPRCHLQMYCTIKNNGGGGAHGVGHMGGSTGRGGKC